ncbi:hypothetical protein ACLOJK_011243 [Asimina triloba]
MGVSRFAPFSLFLAFLAVFLLHTPRASAADLLDFAFKGCAEQTSSDISGFQDNLSGLLNAFVAQASSAKFFKISAGSGQSSVSGLFQCRGDLSNDACRTCVRRIVDKSSDYCGRSVAVRIQLAGCYINYEIAGSQQDSGTKMLYKTCSRSQASFEEKRDTAFAAVQGGIAAGNGFYVTTYGSVFAIAQCEGDLSAGDCGECVKEAVQQAQAECGSSTSGQIYLSRCYISYTYYPNGVPGHSKGSGQDTGKTVAIVFGGAFALFFVVICLLFLRSLRKKRDGSMTVLMEYSFGGEALGAPFIL